MPAPDGLEVCRQLKAVPELQDVRVLMMTGAAMDEAEAVAVGSDAYLTKPFSPIQLLETIEILLVSGPSNR